MRQRSLGLRSKVKLFGGDQKLTSHFGGAGPGEPDRGLAVFTLGCYRDEGKDLRLAKQFEPHSQARRHLSKGSDGGGRFLRPRRDFAPAYLKPTNWGGSPKESWPRSTCCVPAKCARVIAR